MSRRPILSLVAFSLSLVLAAGSAAAQASLPAAIDAIVEAPIKAGKVAGASVAVVRGGQTLVERGYGLADLQLDVPTPPRAIYEIGSVTKQFTAAAILLLAEDGKLSLDDELTKFLPEYPTAGHRVTLRHLLNHTSGIKGYTEMPDIGSMMAMKKTPAEIVKLFSSQPFDFAPGEDLIYNNSAFFLLGLIIEKASGQPYADFIKSRLFDKIGMTDSSYCSERTIQKRKVHGYDTINGALVLKAAIDHGWPYAAGSLCSSAHDLVLWNRALHGGKVLSADSYRAMITPASLNDGAATRYTMGLGVTNTGGRRLIAHGGGIFGYLSQLDYYPDDDLTIVVLFNTAGPVNPQTISREIAEAVRGKAPVAERAFDGDLSAFAGSYSGRGRGAPTSIRIEARSGALHFLRGTTVNETLTYLGDDTFGFRDTLVRFYREGGRVTGLRLDNVGTNVKLTRTN